MLCTIYIIIEVHLDCLQRLCMTGATAGCFFVAFLFTEILSTTYYKSLYSSTVCKMVYGQNGNDSTPTLPKKQPFTKKATSVFHHLFRWTDGYLYNFSPYPDLIPVIKPPHMCWYHWHAIFLFFLSLRFRCEHYPSSKCIYNGSVRWLLQIFWPWALWQNWFISDRTQTATIHYPSFTSLWLKQPTLLAISVLSLINIFPSYNGS